MQNKLIFSFNKRIHTFINRKRGDIMLCKHCQQPLDVSQTRGEYKSCPNCSQNSDEHIFYPSSSFGWTEKRVTPNNPTGIHSWCTRCRGNGTGPYSDGIKCSNMRT